MTNSALPDRLRVLLEKNHQFLSADYEVVVTWTDDGTLHAARCDYSDSSDEGFGMDIPDHLALLQWLVADRFGRTWDGFLEYCAQRGIELAATPERKAPTDHPSGIVIGKDLAGVFAFLDDFGASGAPQGVTDWRELTLLLIRDRCQGSGAWTRLQDLLQSAGLVGVARSRGYV